MSLSRKNWPDFLCPTLHQMNVLLLSSKFTSFGVNGGVQVIFKSTYVCTCVSLEIELRGLALLLHMYSLLYLLKKEKSGGFFFPEL